MAMHDRDKVLTDCAEKTDCVIIRRAGRGFDGLRLRDDGDRDTVSRGWIDVPD